MTNPTPHGQVPEALIDLIDAYAETRHRCGGIYNARTEAARKAVIEALSGVQALSAAPAIKPLVWSDESGPTDKIRYNHITAETALGQFSVEWKGWKEEDGPCVYLAGDYIGVASDLGGAKQLAERHIRELVANLLAAPATPTAEQQATTTEGCMQPMPDKCDQNTWRGPYYHLPLSEQASPKAAPVAQTAPAPGERCQHCIDRHDGVYGSWAAPCPYHDDDGKPRPTANAAPQQKVQEPCPTCVALARTVMLDQVSFDRKPDCYGIRQITDDESVEEWEDIRTSPDVAREEANDMMATGRGEIYEVVPLWTTPQLAPQSAPVCHHRPPCDECAAIAAQRGK